MVNKAQTKALQPAAGEFHHNLKAGYRLKQEKKPKTFIEVLPQKITQSPFSAFGSRTDSHYYVNGI